MDLVLGLGNLDVTAGDGKDAAETGLPEASRCPRVATANVGVQDRSRQSWE